MTAHAQRLTLRAIRVVSPFTILFLWEIAVRAGWLDARFFPAPSSIAGDFGTFVRSGDLAVQTGATLVRILIGFLAGAIPGVALGLVMGVNRWVDAYVDPLVGILYAIPKTATLPLVILIFGGRNENFHYALVALGVIFVMIINTRAGVRQIERIFFDVAHAYRLRPATLYLRVLLPGALPNIIAGAKIGVGLALVLAVVSEFTLTTNGLGFTIWNGWQTLQVERMYVALVVVSVLGYALSLALDLAERFAAPWYRR